MQHWDLTAQVTVRALIHSPPPHEPTRSSSFHLDPDFHSPSTASSSFRAPMAIMNWLWSRHLALRHCSFSCAAVVSRRYWGLWCCLWWSAAFSGYGSRSASQLLSRVVGLDSRVVKGLALSVTWWLRFVFVGEGVRGWGLVSSLRTKRHVWRVGLKMDAWTLWKLGQAPQYSGL